MPNDLLGKDFFQSVLSYHFKWLVDYTLTPQGELEAILKALKKEGESSGRNLLGGSL